MFRRTEEGADDPSSRDEIAYEDNWYRSLKALSEHRALQQESEPEDEPAEGADAAAEFEAEPVVEPPVEVEAEPVVEPAPEVEPEPVVEPAPEVEPVVEFEPGPEVEPEPVAEFEPVEGSDLIPEIEVEPEVARVDGPGAPVWSQLPSAEADEVLAVPVGFGRSDASVSSAGPEMDEVQELSARTENLIDRLRTLRYPEEERSSTAGDRSTNGGGGTGAGSQDNEELSTRAQQLLERLRTLRSLGDEG